MSVLRWKHGRSMDEAVALIRIALDASGHGGTVTWDGAKAEARVGPFAAAVHVLGEVTVDAVVLEKCGGIFGGAVLIRCRELLGQIFPGGELGQ